MASPDGAGPHILVIDDDAALREVICDLLAEEGYRVSSSTTYFDDLDLLIRMGPELVVLDIVLAGQATGMDFLETVKANPRTATIPIAVCTAANHLTDQIQTRLTEWDCLIISKPFDLDDFLGEISRCLHQHDVAPAPA